MTQEALAYDCGINRMHLSAVERSKRNVSIDNIARIAKGLGIEPGKLLRDEDPKSIVAVAKRLPNRR
jgi:transcriptional regulator with XRE-family HTH domain